MVCDYTLILAYNEILRQQLRRLTLSEQIAAYYILTANLLTSIDPDAETNPAVLLKEGACLRCFGLEDQIVAIGAMLCNMAGDLTPPTIVSQPQSVTINEGGSWSMSVVATGSAILKYQWRRNGFVLPGETHSAIVMNNTPLSAAGQYDVIVSNPVGSIPSDPALLRVNPVSAPPVIVQQPQDLVVNEGDAASFTVVATGTPTLTYQWYKNGVEIPGATRNFYSIPVSTLPDAGSFSVRVSNLFGTAFSDGADLTVVSAATFTSYLGNAGPNAPASYTGAQIKALVNDPAPNFVLRNKVSGSYEIFAPVSGSNEYRILAFPTLKLTRPPIFWSGNVPLSMSLVQDNCNIDGIMYSIFRTVTRSAGDFTHAGNTEIVVYQ